MLTRIVKMEFQPEKVDDFITHFDSIKETLRSQPGCVSVMLLQDSSTSNRFFTYSVWLEERDLENYRQSPFFKEVWRYTKQLFNAKPEAWSVYALDI
jgi:quinol monooxygenase YgiN